MPGDARYEISQAAPAALLDDLQPSFHMRGIERILVPPHLAAQDVQIVNLAQYILHALQVRNPGLAALRREILQNVTKLLEPNSQAMPGDAAAPFAGEVVERDSLIQAGKRQALEDDAFEWEKLRLGGELFGKLAPVFQVEPGQGFLAEFLLGDQPLFKRLMEMFANWIGGGAKFPGPLQFDLGVAEFAQGAKQPARGFFHLAPAAVGIDLAEGFGHGAAAAESGAQVVNVVRVPGPVELLGQFGGAGHPVVKTNAFRWLAIANVNAVCHSR